MMPHSNLFGVCSRGRVYTLRTDQAKWEEFEYLGIDFKKVVAHDSVIWALGGDHQIYVYVYGTSVPIRVCEEAYENQRWIPIEGFTSKLLPSDRPPYSCANGLKERSLKSIRLPSLAWNWEADWSLQDTFEGKSLDKECWTYAVDFPRTYTAESNWRSCVRRRKWIRYRRYWALDTWSTIEPLHSDYTKEPFIDIAIGGGDIPGQDSDKLMLWGVTVYGKVFAREGICNSSPEGLKWKNIETPGNIEVTSLSIARNGRLWAVAWDGTVLIRVGISRENPIGLAWIKSGYPEVPLTQISVGENCVWGVGVGSILWYRKGITQPNSKDEYKENTSETGTEWMKMFGSFNMVSVGPNYQVFGISLDDKILVRSGVTPTDLTGKTWRIINLPISGSLSENSDESASISSVSSPRSMEFEKNLRKSENCGKLAEIERDSYKSVESEIDSHKSVDIGEGIASYKSEELRTDFHKPVDNAPSDSINLETNNTYSVQSKSTCNSLEDKFSSLKLRDSTSKFCDSPDSEIRKQVENLANPVGIATTSHSESFVEKEQICDIVSNTSKNNFNDCSKNSFEDNKSNINSKIDLDSIISDIQSDKILDYLRQNSENESALANQQNSENLKNSDNLSHQQSESKLLKEFGFNIPGKNDSNIPGEESEFKLSGDDRSSRVSHSRQSSDIDVVLRNPDDIPDSLASSVVSDTVVNFFDSDECDLIVPDKISEPMDATFHRSIIVNTENKENSLTKSDQNSFFKFNTGNVNKCDNNFNQSNRENLIISDKDKLKNLDCVNGDEKEILKCSNSTSIDSKVYVLNAAENFQNSSNKNSHRENFQNSSNKNFPSENFANSLNENSPKLKFSSKSIDKDSSLNKKQEIKNSSSFSDKTPTPDSILNFTPRTPDSLSANISIKSNATEGIISNSNFLPEGAIWLSISASGCWIEPNNLPKWFLSEYSNFRRSNEPWRAQILEKLIKRNDKHSSFKGYVEAIDSPTSWSVDGHCRFKFQGQFVAADIKLVTHTKRTRKNPCNSNFTNENSSTPTSDATATTLSPTNEFSGSIRATTSASVILSPTALTSSLTSPTEKASKTLVSTSENLKLGEHPNNKSQSMFSKNLDSKLAIEERDKSKQISNLNVLYKNSNVENYLCLLCSYAKLVNLSVDFPAKFYIELFMISYPLRPIIFLFPAEKDAESWLKMIQFSTTQVPKTCWPAMWALSSNGLIYISKPVECDPKYTLERFHPKNHGFDKLNYTIHYLKHGFDPGSSITIKGTVLIKPQRFRIDFLTQANENNIAFHFNARFDQKVIVMNIRRDHTWFHEERIALKPISKGSRCKLEFQCKDTYILVFINGISAYKFFHRLSPMEITNLSVQGDFITDEIVYRCVESFSLRRISHTALSNVSWHNVGGHLSSVDCGPEGIVWGIAFDSRVYVYTGGFKDFTNAPEYQIVDYRMVYTWENQRWNPVSGFSPSSLLPTDRRAWSDVTGRVEMTRQSIKLISRTYSWVGDWMVDLHPPSGCDAEGWQYGTDFPYSYHPSSYVTDLVRRRRWCRKYRVVSRGPWKLLDKINLISVSISSEVDLNGSVSVWAITSSNEVVFREGVSCTNPSGENWVLIPSNCGMLQVFVGKHGVVWAVSVDGRAHVRLGVSENNPKGIEWVNVDAPSNPLIKVCGSGNQVWGLDKIGHLYYRANVRPLFPEGTSWIQIQKSEDGKEEKYVKDDSEKNKEERVEDYNMENANQDHPDMTKISDFCIGKNGFLYAILNEYESDLSELSETPIFNEVGTQKGILARRIGITTSCPGGNGWDIAVGINWSRISAR